MTEKGKRRKLFPLCALGMLVLMMLLPLYVVPADAAFSSIIITDVTPTELSPGDTKEVSVTVKNNGDRTAKDIRLSFQGT